MARTRQVYVCDQCGDESLQWQGLCSACGSGDSLKAITISKGNAERKKSLAALSGAPQRLSQVANKDDPPEWRADWKSSTECSVAGWSWDQ